MTAGIPLAGAAAKAPDSGGGEMANTLQDGHSWLNYAIGAGVMWLVIVYRLF